MWTMVLIFLAVIPVVCVMGWLWGTYAPKTRAGSRPADDPAGGFASAAQLQQRMSADALRASSGQVRPGLQPQLMEPVKKTRKGLPRGRR